MRQNKKLVCFAPKGVGFGEGAVPHAQYHFFFEISVLISIIWCILVLEAFRCRKLETVMEQF